MRIAVAVLALIVLLSPTLAGQSTQNHDERYMVVGRVLDGDGLPANRLSVRAELVGIPSPPAPQAIPTNCQGDFVMVFPVRELGDGHVRVTIGVNTTTHELDPVTRRTHVKLTTSGTFATPECEASRDLFADRHVVTGRIVEPDGRPIVGANVTVTVRFAIGDEQARSAETNQAGDFAVLFQSGRFGQATAADTASITWQDRTWTVELDGTFGVTVADQVVDRGSAPLIALVAGTLALAAAGVLVWLWYGRGVDGRRR